MPRATYSSSVNPHQVPDYIRFISESIRSFAKLQSDIIRVYAKPDDFISYFRWRTCAMGTEIYWHGILDYSGRENRRLREIRQIHEKIKAISQVAGAVYEAQVEVLKDYDNLWDAEVDRWHQRVDSVSQEALFAVAQRSHTPLDYVYLTDSLKEDLKKYKVLFYPHATIISEERVQLLSK